MVDVKDPTTGKTISYKNSIGKYVFKVEPHRAILEDDYFIRLIIEAEKVRGKEIDKADVGFLSPDEESTS